MVVKMLYEPQEYGAVLKRIMKLAVGRNFSSNSFEAQPNSDEHKDWLILVGMGLAKPGHLSTNGYVIFSVTRAGIEYLKNVID